MKLYSMKIKEQTRKLATGCSKHYSEAVDRTDEVSSKHYFEVADRTDEVSNHTHGKATLTRLEEIFEEYYHLVPQKPTSSYELVDFSSMRQHFLGDFLAR